MSAVDTVDIDIILFYKLLFLYFLCRINVEMAVTTAYCLTPKMFDYGNIIVATEEQIQEAVFNAVSKFFSGNQQAVPSSDLPDTLSMPNALKVLEDNGFPTSKAKLYKMTSQEQIPFMKYGNKLVFSRKALIEWAHKQLVSNSSEGCDSATNIQKCFKRKR